ncbi:type II toxin-antitoxin system PemK/MazF family toxin [Actinokineospora enzanensis]|uniref:type II toxin-antitoxin system PemK/MazF family toxin n=1 Tax=Actinokineospora enzanensis TaxID=155975 RepID=UPI00037CBE67|nr:type II toxin-antitoxin system PemK/MazF family toxin [Actinokineospora enzanensis]
MRNFSEDDPRPARGAVWQVPTSDRPDHISYSPDLDGDADPGEIVWAWVPYEDDPDRGKDRPLLVVGRTGRTLRAMMLSSKHPHDNERDDWLELGSGEWDRDGRKSYLRLNRLFELGEHDIRREGSILEPDRFTLVADALAARYGWR